MFNSVEHTFKPTFSILLNLFLIVTSSSYHLHHPKCIVFFFNRLCMCSIESLLLYLYFHFLKQVSSFYTCIMLHEYVDIIYRSLYNYIYISHIYISHIYIYITYIYMIFFYYIYYNIYILSISLSLSPQGEAASPGGDAQPNGAPLLSISGERAVPRINGGRVEWGMDRMHT